jgi:hypothetical protein
VPRHEEMLNRLIPQKPFPLYELRKIPLSVSTKHWLKSLDWSKDKKCYAISMLSEGNPRSPSMFLMLKRWSP